jgi:hypothetical protein
VLRLFIPVDLNIRFDKRACGCFEIALIWVRWALFSIQGNALEILIWKWYSDFVIQEFTIGGFAGDIFWPLNSRVRNPAP